MLDKLVETNDGKLDVLSQNMAQTVMGFPGLPASKCGEMGHNFTCPLTAGSGSYMEVGNVGQQGNVSAGLSHHRTARLSLGPESLF